MSKSVLNLPDIAVRRIWLPDAVENEKTGRFFENSIQPPLQTFQTTAINSQNNRRVCAYTLLRERLESCFPQIGHTSLSYGESGKPYLATPFQDIFINLSHSGSYVMCGICDYEIGVDIQKKRIISSALIIAIAPEIPPEKVVHMSDMEKTRLFCEKESRIKAQGKSILDMVSVQAKDGRRIYSFAVECADSEYAAYYSLYKLKDTRSFTD